MKYAITSNGSLQTFNTDSSLVHHESVWGKVRRVISQGEYEFLINESTAQLDDADYARLI